jgi:hypothetical protein
MYGLIIFVIQQMVKCVSEENNSYARIFEPKRTFLRRLLFSSGACDYNTPLGYENQGKSKTPKNGRSLF